MTTPKKDGGRGQALVEFSLAVSVFLMLLMGIFDLGRGIYMYNSVAEAAREIARATSVHASLPLGTSPASLGAVGTQKGLVPNLGDPTYTCVNIAGTPLPPATKCVPGNWVKVTISAAYSPVTPVLGLVGTWNMQSSSTMLIEPD